MDIESLQIFLEVAEHRSYSHVARDRNIAVSVVSRRVAALEAWLGNVPLFDREKFPLVLTYAGEVLVSKLGDGIFTLSEIRVGLLAPSSSRHVVKFAALHSLSTSFFPTWWMEVNSRLSTKELPFGVLSSMWPTNLGNCISLLLDDAVDFVLCYEDRDNPLDRFFRRQLSSVELGEDRLVPVCNADWKARAARALAQPDSGEKIPYLRYSDDAYLRGAVARILDGARLRDCLVEVHSSSMATELRNMARVGCGVAWVPASVAKNALHTPAISIGNARRARGAGSDEPLELYDLSKAETYPNSISRDRLGLDLQVVLFRKAPNAERTRPFPKNAQAVWADVAGQHPVSPVEAPVRRPRKR